MQKEFEATIVLTKKVRINAEIDDLVLELETNSVSNKPTLKDKDTYEQRANEVAQQRQNVAINAETIAKELVEQLGNDTEFVIQELVEIE